MRAVRADLNRSTVLLRAALSSISGVHPWNPAQPSKALLVQQVKQRMRVALDPASLSVSATDPCPAACRMGQDRDISSLMFSLSIAF